MHHLRLPKSMTLCPPSSRNVCTARATDTSFGALGPSHFSPQFHPRGYGVSARLLDGDQLDSMAEGIQSDAPDLATDMSDCVVVPAAGRALCYAWQGDNKGPHSPNDV